MPIQGNRLFYICVLKRFSQHDNLTDNDGAMLVIENIE